MPTAPASARRVLAICSAAVFVAYIDVSIVNVALPTLGRDLHASIRATSWVIAAYNVTFTALLVTAGRIADAHGRRRVFVGGLLAFGAGSALCAAAWDVPSLVAFRIVQGVGAAVLVPVSLALLLPHWPAERRGAAIGWWGAAGALAAGLGPPAGGLLSALSWRLIFLVNVPIALAAAFSAHRRLAETSPSAAVHVDRAGVGVLGVVVAAAVLAVTEAPVWGVGSIAVGSLAAAAAVGVAVLVLLERRSVAPILDLGLLRIRSFAVGTAAATLFYFAFLGYTLAGVLFLQSAWGYSPVRAGVAYAVGPLSSVLTNMYGGRLVDRIGARTVGGTGLGLFAAALLGFAILLPARPAYLAGFLPFLLVAAGAISLTFPALTGAATGDLPPYLLATGTSALNTIRQIGGVLGIAAVVAIAGGAGEGAAAFRVVYGVLAVAAGMAAIAILALRRRPHALA